jgi:glucan endo-1,3-alpha-glucosidase
MKLMSMPNAPDFIQIISWNDYGESHYIGPRLGTPPADTIWLLVNEIMEDSSAGGWWAHLLFVASSRDGFDHQSWLKMSDYFIKWYKTGARPTIEEDSVHFNYRPHSVNAIACEWGLFQRISSADSDISIVASYFTQPPIPSHPRPTRQFQWMQSMPPLILPLHQLPPNCASE